MNLSGLGPWYLSACSSVDPGSRGARQAGRLSTLITQVSRPRVFLGRKFPMKATKKAVSAKVVAHPLFEEMQKERDARRGPRIDKWRTEYKSLQKRLPKLEPGSEEFNAAYHRFMKLGMSVGVLRYPEKEDWITSLIVPELAAKAAKLQEMLKEEKRSVSVNVRASLYANGWLPRVQVILYPSVEYLQRPTAGNITGDLVKILRQEARAIMAMADKIEHKAKRKAAA